MSDEAPIETGPVDTPEAPVEPTEPVEKSQEEVWAEFLKEKPLVLKVNGKDREIKDLADLKKHAGLGTAAYEKMAEAARMREEAEALSKKYKEASLLDILRERGIEGDKVFDEVSSILDLIEKEKSEDPRDRKLKEFEEAERKRKEAEEAEKQTKEQREYQAKVQEYQQQLANDIHAAANKFGMPESPFLLKQVANELESAWASGLELTAEEAVRIVQNDFVSEYVPYVRGMGVDLVEQVLGPDMIKALRKKWVGEAKQAEVPFSTPAQKKRGEKQAQPEGEDARTVDLTPRGKYGKLFSQS